MAAIVQFIMRESTVTVFDETVRDCLANITEILGYTPPHIILKGDANDADIRD